MPFSIGVSLSFMPDCPESVTQRHKNEIKYEFSDFLLYQVGEILLCKVDVIWIFTSLVDCKLFLSKFHNDC